MAKTEKKDDSEPVSQVAALQAKLVPIDAIRLDPKNAREHNDRSLASISESLKKFGQQKPIVVDNDNVIRAGNGTWLAAKRLGWQSINVIVTGLDAEAAALYAVSDNRLSELSYFDDAMLAEQLKEVDAVDLIALGFDDAELAAIFDSQREPEDGGDKKTSKSMGNQHTVMVRMMIAVSNVELVERAMSLTGEINRETALLAVCRAYCDSKVKVELD